MLSLLSKGQDLSINVPMQRRYYQPFAFIFSGHPNAGAALLRSTDADTVASRIEEIMEGDQRTAAQISDLMSFPVITVSVDTPMNEVARILRQRGCTGLPVVNNGQIIGIITRSDTMLYFYDLLPD